MENEIFKICPFQLAIFCKFLAYMEVKRFASALLVSGEFFNVLGVRPLLGRFLTHEDDRRNCSSPGVVLSHAFWQKEFGGDASVIGRKTTRYPFEIIGVAPEGFTGLEVGRRFDVAVPLCAEWLPPGSESRLDSGVDWWLIVMGRLKPGWTLERASDLAGGLAGHRRCGRKRRTGSPCRQDSILWPHFGSNKLSRGRDTLRLQLYGDRFHDGLISKLINRGRYG